MNPSEYAALDGIALAELVAAGHVTAAELADVARAAIDQVNPQLNAVIGPLDAVADDAIRHPRRGPFSGVPFLIKDIGMHYADVPHEMGSRFAKGFRFPHDTELALRFKQSGLVTLGRTNTPEFGCNASTEPVANGPSRNPWNLAHSTGGSSGGSAAAVAAGVVPFAHANDGGGSIRIPAACCGLVGLKPSRGRMPAGPDSDDLIFGMGVELVVSRTVRDTAAVLDATHGPDVGARLFLPSPAAPYRRLIDRPPSRLRVAFTRTSPDGAVPMDPECRRGVERTAALLEELGHLVEEASPVFDHQAACLNFLDLAAAFFGGGISLIEQLTGRTPSRENLEATTFGVYQYGRDLTAFQLGGAFARINQLARQMGAFFSRYDLWLTPTMAVPPVKLGVMNAAEELGAPEWIVKILSLAPFTAPFNATGQPAISLPLHHGEDGLPIGIQFVARLGDEASLLQLAKQLEDAAPWIGRRPPVFVGK
ncbi:MAG: amidase [Gemmatimonadetes bacterium]|nr:amidase [Gemmatimonadota bacterium]